MGIDNLWNIGNRLPQFRTLCLLEADLSILQSSLKLKEGPKEKYYEVNYSIAIRFGGTQLQARLQWNEGVRMTTTTYPTY